MKQTGRRGHQIIVADHNHDRTAAPNADRIREEAILGGGLDPHILRFRVVEYEKATGERLRIPLYNLSFLEALEQTRALIARNDASHFCLEPIGFLQ